MFSRCQEKGVRPFFRFAGQSIPPNARAPHCAHAKLRGFMAEPGHLGFKVAMPDSTAKFDSFTVNIRSVTGTKCLGS